MPKRPALRHATPLLRLSNPLRVSQTLPPPLPTLRTPLRGTRFERTPMEYIAIATFSRDPKTAREVFLRRRNYTYPAEFKNTQSFVDVQGGRAVIHFETTTAESIQRYTADWPELTFDIFPVVPSDKAWEAYLETAH